jgi:DnaJ family protein C protein 28
LEDDVRDPLQKASDNNIIVEMRRQSAEQELRGVVERKIVEAQKKGHFDNLAGKGRPLRLGKNRQAGDQALAFELLKNNDYTIPWIAARRKMLDAIAVFRADLAAAWQRYQRRLSGAHGVNEQRAIEDSWQAGLDGFDEQIRKLNKEISALNLTIPVERLEVLKLSLARELLRAGGPR